MEAKKEIVIYLRPGDFYATGEPVIIKTVLGSCIAVCLHDKVNKVGGANHYVLPHKRNNTGSIMNYGETAIPVLIDTVIRQGGDKRYLAAQIIGGSCSHSSGILDVGKSNIELAHKMLQEYSIPITYEDVGGATGRVICFAPCTNDLYIRPAGGTDRAEDMIAAVETSSATAQENSIQLTTGQVNFLSGLFTSALQRAQQSLATMLGTSVELAVSESLLRKMWYVQEYAERRFQDFLITTGQKELVPLGEVIMMMDPGKVATIINTLLRRPVTNPLQYDRMESATIIELGNIVINAILGTLANHLEFAMMLRVPKLIRSRAELSNLPFMNKSKEWKVSLGIKNNLKIPALGIDTLMLLMVELNSPYIFFEKLGG